MKIFGREPTLWLALLSSMVVLLGTFGFHWLNGTEASLIVVAINAVAAAATAYTVRPVAPAAFTYAVASIIAVAGAYGLLLSIDTVAALNAFVITTLALLTRGQVTPQDTSVSHA